MVCANLVQKILPSERQRKRTRYLSSAGPAAKHGLTSIKLVLSLADDADLLADWLFFSKTLEKDYVPQWVKYLQLVLCLVATVLWLIEVTEGRIICLDRCNISFKNRYFLILGIIFEDVSQIILSFLIDNYYGYEGLTEMALINVMTSLYNIYFKIAEAWVGESEDGDIMDTDRAMPLTY